MNYKKNYLKLLVQLIVIGLIFFFLGKHLFENWRQLSFYSWEINYFSIIISITILLLAFCCLPVGAKLVLNLFDKNLILAKIFKVYFYSQIAKYIPGGFWALIGRGYFYSQEGIEGSITFSTLFIELSLLIISGLIIFFTSLLFWEKVDEIRLIYPLLFIIPLGLISLHPKIFLKIADIFSKKLRRPSPSLNLGYLNILKLLLFYNCFWCLVGIAFYFFVISLAGIDISILVFIGIFGISWAIGFLSFLTPGGIGVREGVLTFLLSLHLPVSVAILISLLSRIWWIISELICIGAIFFWINILQPKRKGLA